LHRAILAAERSTVGLAMLDASPRRPSQYQLAGA
jgi:hypothetical protein